MLSRFQVTSRGFSGDEGRRLDKKFLLQRYNPLLVLLPQDATLDRPGGSEVKRRGDYHPIDVKLFLERVIQRDQPRPLFWHGPPHEVAAGIDALKQRVAQEGPQATQPWELDLANMRSADAEMTWLRYGELLRSVPEAKDAVVYGRCIETDLGVALQYWYFYMYNDAANKHEGDWEMVSLELDKESLEPVQAGYSGHESGARRQWAGVQKQGSRPVVFVARGSHAAYLDYMPAGHPTKSYAWRKNLPAPLQVAVDLYQGLTRALRGVKDETPAAPDYPEDVEKGEIVDAKRIEILPELDEFQGMDDFWWMGLNCPWGSSHARIYGFVAPEPPWKKPRWNQPIEWIRGLNER